MSPNTCRGKTCRGSSSTQPKRPVCCRISCPPTPPGFRRGPRGLNGAAARGRFGAGGEASVLLGDAAHAMPPFLGQGTNQAIQDAACLADKLVAVRAGDLADVDAALAAYESDRKAAVARLGFNSVVLGAVETLAPEGFRDAFFRTTAALGVAKMVFLDGATPEV